MNSPAKTVHYKEKFMTRGKSAPITVNLLREGLVESVQYAQAVVCDRRGRTLSVAGDHSHATFIRSALKPFQALAVTTGGILEKYELGDRDLAVICSSHAGEIIHTRQAFNVLWRAELDAEHLQCPIPDCKKSALEHNCSGKHAGMLAVCRAHGWPVENYLERQHPVQRLILQQLSDLLKMPADEFICTHDDCGAPTYLMQLDQMATLYAHLASGDSLGLERIVRSMVHHPELIGGEGRFDTELMRLTQGELVSKSGAEGIQCIGKVGEGMGLAIKANDGSARSKYATALHLLQQMGWVSPAVVETMATKFINVGEYTRLDVIGELAMD
jgi:L-asparaginase